jgi:hypothetical protein
VRNDELRTVIVRGVSAKFTPDFPLEFISIMNATATKTVRERLLEQIASIREEAEEAKRKQEYEFAFVLYDKIDQLEAQLDAQYSKPGSSCGFKNN